MHLCQDDYREWRWWLCPSSSQRPSIQQASKPFCFDTTGMFYWCPTLTFEQQTIVRLASHWLPIDQGEVRSISRIFESNVNWRIMLSVVSSPKNRPPWLDFVVSSCHYAHRISMRMNWNRSSSLAIVFSYAKNGDKSVIFRKSTSSMYVNNPKLRKEHFRVI